MITEADAEEWLVDHIRELEEQLAAANKIIAAYNQFFLTMPRSMLDSLVENNPAIIRLAKEAIEEQ